MNKKGIFHILFGVIIFLSRYIPLFHYRGHLLDQWYSIVDYSKACNTVLDIVLDNCELINILNTSMIVVSVLFVIYGFIYLFKR
jgi:hypothetical protein